MRHKRFLALLLAAAMLLCTGCQLARADSDEAQGQDQLIGVFVTTEYLDLFDFDAYFQDNAEKLVMGGSLTEEDTQPYQGRLYATLTSKTLYSNDGEATEAMNYVFEGVEGISFFAARFPAAGARESYVGNSSDEAVSDGSMHLSYTDEEDGIDLEATIYIASRPDLDPNQDLEQYTTYYFNPVYQTPDGRVYVMSGSGFTSTAADAGAIYTQTLEDEKTITVNGETKIHRSYVKVSIAAMDPPEEIVVLQMDESGQLLSRKAYIPGALPEKLTLDTKADYLIVETKGSESVKRELLEPDAESMETFRCRNDGICVKEYTELVWSA